MVHRRVRGGQFKIKHVEKKCPVELGNEWKKPVGVFFAPVPFYPHANWRHYAFLQQGIADIAEVELYWRCAERIPHVVLLLLVAAEDADFADACAQVSPKYGITERTGAACDD